jgi:peptidoglycan/xylan/chitin deacetylase (PgdA/CDA1 family)
MRRVILNFHGIGQPGRDLEPGEALYWVAPDFFAAVLDLAERHSERVETGFTFDDGNLSDLEIAGEQLVRRKRRASFFVLADRLGLPGALGPDGLRALRGMGHEIGSHGAAHVDWRKADGPELRRELEIAREMIATAAGAPVTAAALPFGRYNRRVLMALARQGYDRVYCSDGGDWRPGDRPIPRTSPRADMGIDRIEALLRGHEPPLRRARRWIARGIKRHF